MPSPTMATASPAYHELQVGRARRSAAIAVRPPSATRRRARNSTTSAIRFDALRDRRRHFLDRDVVDARRSDMTLPLIQALAAIGALHDDIALAPRSVAFGERGAKERHERRAHGARNVQRAGIA